MPHTPVLSQIKKAEVEGYHQKGSPKVTGLLFSKCGGWDGIQEFLSKKALTHYYKTCLP